MRFYNTGKCRFTKNDKGELADLAVPGQSPGAAIVYGRVVEAKQCIDLADDMIKEDVLRAHPSLALDAEMPAVPPAAKLAPAKLGKE